MKLLRCGILVPAGSQGEYKGSCSLEKAAFLL